MKIGVKDKTPNIHTSAYVDETALVIGDVTIGADSSIRPMTVVRGDVNTIMFGERTNIQDACVVHVTSDSEYNPGGFPLTVGDDCYRWSSCHPTCLHCG